MKPTNDALIAELAQDLAPVRAMTARGGYLLIGLAAAVTFLAVWLLAGMWDGVLTGAASPYFVITNGLLVLVGLSAVSATIALASPHVGNRHDGVRWAVATLAVLPLAALLFVFGRSGNLGDLMDPHAIVCLAAGTSAGAVVFAGLAYWLRRGAPVSPVQAGTVAGIASGAAGSAIYGMSCPIDGLVHLGIWHVLPILAGAALGRLILPSLIRW